MQKKKKTHTENPLMMKENDRYIMSKLRSVHQEIVLREWKKNEGKFSLYIHLVMVFISKIYEELLKINKKKTILWLSRE